MNRVNLDKTKKTYVFGEDLSSNNIEVKIVVNPGKATELIGTFKEPCPFCGDEDCRYDCDESQAEGKSDERRHRYNDAMDALESFLIAMAVEGIDLDDTRIRMAIQVTLDACQREFYQ